MPWALEYLGAVYEEGSVSPGLVLSGRKKVNACDFSEWTWPELIEGTLGRRLTKASRNAEREELVSAFGETEILVEEKKNTCFRDAGSKSGEEGVSFECIGAGV